MGGPIHFIWRDILRMFWKDHPCISWVAKLEREIKNEEWKLSMGGREVTRKNACLCRTWVVRKVTGWQIGGNPKYPPFWGPPISLKHPQDNFSLQNANWHPPKCTLGRGDFCTIPYKSVGECQFTFSRVPIYVLEAEIVLGVLYRKGWIPKRGVLEFWRRFSPGSSEHNTTILRTQWFTEWPRPLDWMAFPVEFLTIKITKIGKRGFQGQETPFNLPAEKKTFRVRKSPFSMWCPVEKRGFSDSKRPFLGWGETGFLWPQSPLFPILGFLTPVQGGRNRNLK